MGFEIPKPRSSLLIDTDAWVTMLVFRFLEDSIPEENNLWCLVVETARCEVLVILTVILE
ncbi:hypothetical protein BPOR_0927g00040 [Botrytis porri]|uniref:Uncharacterized protein n=1 Tax=Botrytis porri TaxID=87229 RepID=A0A4Z1K7L0_9HELO|nr:hypothetical protein BPOR_0927g00040 [Botrytis porri]